MGTGTLVSAVLFPVQLLNGLNPQPILNGNKREAALMTPNMDPQRGPGGSLTREQFGDGLVLAAC